MSYFYKKRLEDPYWWIVVAISFAVIFLMNLFIE